MVAAKAAGDLGSVPQQQNVMESCFRAYQQSEPSPGDTPSPVIVRLVNRNFKVAVLKNRRAITAANPGEAGSKRVIVVEDLTQPAHKLLKELQGDSRVEKVWSVNGQIHYSRVGVAGYKKVKNIFDSIDTILS